MINLLQNLSEPTVPTRKFPRGIPPSQSQQTSPLQYLLSFSRDTFGGCLQKAQDLNPNFKHPIVLDPSHGIQTVNPWFWKEIDQSMSSLKSDILLDIEKMFGSIPMLVWSAEGWDQNLRFRRFHWDGQLWPVPGEDWQAYRKKIRYYILIPHNSSSSSGCTYFYWCLHMAVLRFTACHCTPAELYSVQGSNFRVWERLFLSWVLQGLLVKHQINFHFNPSVAPHFRGVWEQHSTPLSEHRSFLRRNISN